MYFNVQHMILILIIVCVIELIWILIIANKIDTLERNRKKYYEFLEDEYNRYMREDYKAKHRFKDAKKYAPGGPEDRL